ncbi:hypothetical protein HJC23_009017 [Cyclotella cryptica]|uniref:DUF4246 domain-containing protein n=1 Tax=Cyclotella cryptica TaxID=29204 RepID=A0ABD3QYF8_9STRA
MKRDVYDAGEVRQRIFDGDGVRFESFMELASDTITLEEASKDEPRTIGLQVDEALKGRLAKLVRSTVSQITQANSICELEQIINSVGDQLSTNALFLPVNNDEQGVSKACEGMEFSAHTSWERMITSQMIVTFVIPEKAECVVAVNQDDGYLQLKTPNGPYDFGVNGVILAARRPQSSYIAPIVETIQSFEGSKSYRANVLIETIAHSSRLSAVMIGTLPTSSVAFDSLEQHQHRLGPVEGVVVADDAISKDLIAELSGRIDALAAHQERTNCVDYHPQSNGIVRDLVHPGLYSYVKGVTELCGSVDDVPPCNVATLSRAGSENTDEGNAMNVEQESENKENIDVKEQYEVDFWGRPYESSLYQWLPTYFAIDAYGRCTIEDYINNLTPREHPVNSVLYQSLARLFEQSIPYIESVYSYVRAIRPMMRDDHSDFGSDNDSDSSGEIDIKPYSLKDNRLQVITKIVDYELKPGQIHEGVWHVEGMSHEEIVLTALYILDRDDCINGGDLLFKRAFFQDEVLDIFESVPQIRSDLFESYIEEGLYKLGKVETPKGRLIVFPNSHVHKVTEMINVYQHDGSGGVSHTSKRRIVVFFLVNPQKRIISTREVAPQRGGNMTHQQALDHRLKLMKERKFHKQDWNVREIELCEH